MDGRELHAELCMILGVLPGRGAQLEVAQRIGVPHSSYRRYVSGGATLSQGRAAELLVAAGATVELAPGGSIRVVATQGPGASIDTALRMLEAHADPEEAVVATVSDLFSRLGRWPTEAEVMAQLRADARGDDHGLVVQAAMVIDAIAAIEAIEQGDIDVSEYIERQK